MTNGIMFSIGSLIMVIALTVIIIEPKEKGNITTFKIALTICMCYIIAIAMAMLLGKIVIIH